MMKKRLLENTQTKKKNAKAINIYKKKRSGINFRRHQVEYYRKGCNYQNSKLGIKKKSHKYLRQIRDFFVAIVIATTFFMVLSSFFISIIRVRGYGMVPILREGDVTLIQKTNDFRRFDLVSFRTGHKKFQIRRIIGLPGETISYSKDTLFVNEQPIDEKFLVDAINETKKNGGNYTEDFTFQSIDIPEGYYFVLGDNRPYATDSRYYGLISKKNFLGKVTMQVFPFNEIKAL